MIGLIKLVVEVRQEDIVSNDDGTLTISGATIVPVVGNPIYRILEDFENIDLAGLTVNVPKDAEVKLMACEPNADQEDQSVYQYEGRNFWMPNGNGELLRGNIGTDART